MRFGLDLPNMGACADPRALARLASLAEDCGWDGVFVWDTVYAEMDDPRNAAVCDVWIALAAIAMATRRIRLGSMITPPARRRPWKLAAETVTVDRLSDGRLILPVGLGSLDDGAFGKTNEEKDRKLRAEMLDESLAILDGFWRGQPFSLQGKHYQVDGMAFQPPSVQQPRIPVWVVGAWPRMKSMRRVIQWDGVLPSKYNSSGESLAEEGNALASGMTPTDVREMKAWIDAQRQASTPFDIVLEGHIPGDDPGKAAAIVRPYAEAGATWWIEAIWQLFYKHPGELGPLEERIRQGPPAVE